MRIGILGGGQLGRMIALAAVPLGHEVVVLAQSPDEPACAVARACLGPFEDEGVLDRFAASVDVVTYEFENVPVACVERLAARVPVRPGARYFHSIRLLQQVKEIDPTMFTKSGIMVGLGEERNEVLQLMDDLRSADVDFLTIGQYLQPTRKHHPVERFVTPEEFKSYEAIAYAKGFLMVSSSPLTRSSHHAGEDFAKLQAARQAKA